MKERLPPRITKDEFYGPMKAITEELNEQTDRGVAIVAVALLDERLRSAISVTFEEDVSPTNVQELFEGPAAPLGSFSAKARLGRALGLYDEDFLHDLTLMGRIRNRFAHDLDLRSFADDRVASLCSQLRGSHTVRVNRDMSQEPILKYRTPHDARDTFLMAALFSVHALFGRLHARGLTHIRTRDAPPNEEL